MAYYGNGFTVTELYNLPSYLRNFYYNKLVDAKKKENETVKKEQANTPSKVRIKR